MTRKHFIMIADAMVEMIIAGDIKKKSIDSSIRKMANTLYKTNGNFNRETFENYIKERV